jgi:Alginate export
MKLKNKTLLCKMSLALAPVALLMTIQAASADELEGLGAAIQGGKTNFSLKARYESVETPTTPAVGQAKAMTMGYRFGYETGAYHDFAVNVQAQGVWGNKQYADGQSNSTQAAGLNSVNDPAGVNLSQAHLIYRGIADTTIKQGRQVLRYDDDRWVGNVDWRQNWQTYDATSVTNKSIADTTVQAAYVTNVNRPSTDGASSNGNAHMKSTLVNVNNKSLSFADIVAYNYRLDYTAAAQAAPTLMGSTNTTGVKLAKEGIDVAGFKLGWTGEMAQQKNFKQNTTSYTAKYTNIGASVGGSFGKLTVAQETLGSDNGVGLQTPLATLFAFNGWADKFTVTPKNGLKDSYVRGRSTVAGIVVGADFHQFKSDAGSMNLGREVDLIAEKDLDKNFAVGARAARYKADAESVGANATSGVTLVDTNKAWVYGTYKF